MNNSREPIKLGSGEEFSAGLSLWAGRGLEVSGMTVVIRLFSVKARIFSLLLPYFLRAERVWRQSEEDGPEEEEEGVEG